LPFINDDGNGNTIIDLGGGNSIKLWGVLKADLDENDFEFSLAAPGAPVADKNGDQPLILPATDDGTILVSPLADSADKADLGPLVLPGLDGGLEPWILPQADKADWDAPLVSGWGVAEVEAFLSGGRPDLAQHVQSSDYDWIV